MNKNIRYVREHRIAPLLNDMVLHLLSAKPDEPYDALLGYMYKRFPDYAPTDENANDSLTAGSDVAGSGKAAVAALRGNSGDGVSGAISPTPHKPHPPQQDDEEGKHRSKPYKGGRSTYSPDGKRGSPEHHKTGEKPKSQTAVDLINQLRHNEDLFLATISRNRSQLTGVERAHLQKAENESFQVLQALSDLEANTEVVQRAIAMEGHQTTTAMGLLTLIAENEARFLASLKKAQASTVTPAENQTLTELLEQSEAVCLLTEHIGESAQHCDTAAYDVVLRKTAGEVSTVQDPATLLDMLSSNEELFLEQLAAARKSCTDHHVRDLVTRAECSSVALLNTLEEVGSISTVLSRQKATAAVSVSTSASQAERILADLAANETDFMALLVAASVAAETTPGEKRAVFDAIYISEQITDSAQAATQLQEDVTLSFAAVHGGLSTADVMGCRALNLVNQLHTGMGGLTRDLQTTLEAGGLDQATSDAINEALSGQRALEALLATAQSSQLDVEAALGTTTRGLESVLEQTNDRIHSVLADLKISSAINPAILGSASTNSLIAEFLVSSIDSIAETLETMLTLPRRGALNHLQILARCCVLETQLHSGAESRFPKQIATLTSQVANLLDEVAGDSAALADGAGDALALAAKKQRQLIQFAARLAQTSVAAQVALTA